jgi:hypothetical protein
MGYDLTQINQGLNFGHAHGFEELKRGRGQNGKFPASGCSSPTPAFRIGEMDIHAQTAVYWHTQPAHKALMLRAQRLDRSPHNPRELHGTHTRKKHPNDFFNVEKKKQVWLPRKKHRMKRRAAQHLLSCSSSHSSLLHEPLCSWILLRRGSRVQLRPSTITSNFNLPRLLMFCHLSATYSQPHRRTETQCQQRFLHSHHRLLISHALRNSKGAMQETILHHRPLPSPTLRDR